MSEHTTDIRHPQRLAGGVSNPIERQFNAYKQEHRHVTRYPEKYMQLRYSYPYRDDPLYRWWLAKQNIHEGIGRETEETLQAPLVVGTWHSDLTEEHPAITKPLPEILYLKAMKPQKKGR